MKIQLTELKSVRNTKIVNCSKYITVPGWVWPFDCTACQYDIKGDEMQVVAVPDDHEHNILHYHIRCWEKAGVIE